MTPAPAHGPRLTIGVLRYDGHLATTLDSIDGTLLHGAVEVVVDDGLAQDAGSEGAAVREVALADGCSGIEAIAAVAAAPALLVLRPGDRIEAAAVTRAVEVLEADDAISAVVGRQRHPGDPAGAGPHPFPEDVRGRGADVLRTCLFEQHDLLGGPAGIVVRRDAVGAAGAEAGPGWSAPGCLQLLPWVAPLEGGDVAFLTAVMAEHASAPAQPAWVALVGVLRRRGLLPSEPVALDLEPLPTAG